MVAAMPEGAKVGRRTVAFMIDQAIAQNHKARPSNTGLKVAVAMLTLTPPRQVRREQEAASHGGGHGHDDHGHDALDAHGHAPAAALPAGTAGH